MSLTLDRIRAALARYRLVVHPGPSPGWRVGELRFVAVARGREVDYVIEADVPERRDMLLMAAEQALSSQGRLRTGDREFDTKVLLIDPGPLALGYFDAATRERALALTALGGWVAGGVLRLEMAALAEQEQATLDALVEALLALVERLRLGDEAAQREMARIAESDPSPEVRVCYQNLIVGNATLRETLLVERMQSLNLADDEVLRELTAQLRDSAAARAVRLEAGLRLLALFPLPRIERVIAQSPFDIAAALVERIVAIMRNLDQLAGTDSAEAVKAGARMLLALATTLGASDAATCENLARGLALARVRESLPLLAAMCERALERPTFELVLDTLHHLQVPRRDVVKALGPVGMSRVLAALPGFVSHHPELGAGLLIEVFEGLDPRLLPQRQAYLRAMIATGDRSIAPRLAKHIDTPYHESQLAIVQALGTLGDMNTIAALRPYSEGFFRSGEVKLAAKDAIAAIRQREGARALPGALSMPDGAGPGDLSLDPGDTQGE